MTHILALIVLASPVWDNFPWNGYNCNPKDASDCNYYDNGMQRKADASCSCIKLFYSIHTRLEKLWNTDEARALQATPEWLQYLADEEKWDAASCIDQPADTNCEHLRQITRDDLSAAGRTKEFSALRDGPAAVIYAWIQQAKAEQCYEDAPEVDQLHASLPWLNR